jgi:hypothetical protein
MPRRVVLAFSLLFVLTPFASAEIKLIAVGKIPGTAIDKSKLSNVLEEGTPHNRLGGIGSAIAHISGDRFLLLPDRGPKDGAATYQSRFHIAEVTVEKPKLDFQLKETVLLRAADGKPLLGDQDNLTHRFDPEGARVSSKGQVFIADEYGPKIIEFDLQGKFVREFDVPDRFRVANPSGDPKKESRNKKGRSPNRGFEGLALTPSGKLVAILQSSLLQDGGFDGFNNRILELDPATGKTREFVYQVDSPKHGVNEILAISDTEFLVLERDTVAGTKRFCRLYRISIADATDVSGVDSLPVRGLPAGVKAVSRTLFLDLANYGLMLPEKVEGIAFGRDLADGRKLLIVATDNDFTEHPSWLYAFAVDPGDLK